MKVLFDNIIYSLQSVGGISHYWYFLSKKLLDYDLNLYFIEHENDQNFFRNYLKLNDKLYHKTKGNIFIERFKAISLVDDSDFDIFHSSYYRILKKKKKTKEVITVHDFIEFQNKSRFRVFHRRQLHHAIVRADGIICISEKTKEELLRFFPNIKTKYIEVIHHGVDPYYKVLKQSDLDKFSNEKEILLREREKLVLYVGDRKAKYKRFDDLIKVLKFTEYKLIIAGGGNLRKCEKKLLDSNIKERYFIDSLVDFPTLNFYYNIANCLIYPSLNEGFGKPLLEAAAAGCPYIIHKNRIPSLLKDEWGVELEELTSKSITDAIETCKEIKKNMRRTIKTHEFRSWEDTAKDTLNFYRKVLSNV